MYTLVLCLTLAAPAPKEVKKPAPTIVGEWALQSAVSMGMAIPAGQGPSMISFLADGKCVSTQAGAAKPEDASYTHDPKMSPAHIDIVEGKGMAIPGIYKIEGETLTICVSIGGQRPVNFEASDKIIMLTLKRVKKE